MQILFTFLIVIAIEEGMLWFQSESYKNTDHWRKKPLLGCQVPLDAYHFQKSTNKPALVSISSMICADKDGKDGA